MSAKLNVRTVVLVGLLLACVRVYVRYQGLRREALELPRMQRSLDAMSGIDNSILGFLKHGVRRHRDTWTNACVGRLWKGDPGRDTFGKQYRYELQLVAKMIDEVEAAHLFPPLLEPGNPEVVALLALRDWLNAEAENPDVWECASGTMLDKLDRIEKVLTVHQTCVGQLAALKPIDALRNGTPSLESCLAPLASLPLPDHVPHVERAATAQNERLLPFGGQPGDEQVEVSVNGHNVPFVPSPDGSRVVYVLRRHGRQLVVVDGEEGPEYETVSPATSADRRGSPFFSADSRHVAYEARRDGKSLVVLDGHEGPAWNAIQGLTLSPSGRVAYAAFLDHHWRVLADTNELPSYGDVRPFFVFSPDSARLAYAVTGNGTFVVVDGTPGTSYAGLVTAPVFSPDSRHVAYAARTASGLVVVVDGRERTACDGLLEPGVIFSPDSNRVGYVVTKGGKRVAVVDGVEGPAYERVGHPTFSPDSARYVYCGTRDSRWYVVVDGNESGPYDALVDPGPIFSPDSRHVGFAAKDAWRTRVVVDGQPGAFYEDVGAGGPVFSPDSARVAYVAARGGKAFVILDGREVGPYDRIAASVTFSPDSTRAAYAAIKDGAWRVVVNGSEEGAYEEILGRGLLFSADSGHLAYAARKGGKKIVAHDGREQGPYAELDEASLRFSADSAHLAYAAWHSGWRVVVDGVESTTYVMGFVPGTAPLFSRSRVRTFARASTGPGLVRFDVELAGGPGEDTVARIEP